MTLQRQQALAEDGLPNACRAVSGGLVSGPKREHRLSDVEKPSWLTWENLVLGVQPFQVGRTNLRRLVLKFGDSSLKCPRSRGQLGMPKRYGTTATRQLPETRATVNEELASASDSDEICDEASPSLLRTHLVSA